MQEPAIQKAIEMESIFTKDEILRREYEQREKAIMDYNSAMSAAKRIGHKEGVEEGRKVGIEEGLEQGIEQGILGVALSLLKANMPIHLIAEHTGLPIEKIKTLQ